MGYFFMTLVLNMKMFNHHDFRYILGFGLEKERESENGIRGANKEEG